MNHTPDLTVSLFFDNARIHHSQEWNSVVEGLGGCVLFLPPYSPDFNPIEKAFSYIKQWLERWREFVFASSDPIYPLAIACDQITPELAKYFFEQSIYSILCQVHNLYIKLNKFGYITYILIGQYSLRIERVVRCI